MFTTQVVSRIEPPVSISHRPRPVLVAWAALLAIGLTALVLALTVDNGSGSSSPSHSAASLPQVRDTPPSPAVAAQLARTSVTAGYVRDPRTHALLKAQSRPSATPASVLAGRIRGYH